MAELSFEWNDFKNRINFRKHGISFEEASSVFYDENAILFDDPLLSARLATKREIASYNGHEGVKL